jgi:hypothetical protein
MRRVLSTDGPSGDFEPIAVLAIKLRTRGATSRVCAPPGCAELTARVDLPLPRGAWR